MGLIKEFLAMVSFVWVFGCSCASGLLEHQFYRNSCGAAEMIVKEEVKTSVLTDPSTAAALLRLAFHDCQVDVLLLNTNILFLLIQISSP